MYKLKDGKAGDSVVYLVCSNYLEKLPYMDLQQRENHLSKNKNTLICLAKHKIYKLRRIYYLTAPFLLRTG